MKRNIKNATLEIGVLRTGSSPFYTEINPSGIFHYAPSASHGMTDDGSGWQIVGDTSVYRLNVTGELTVAGEKVGGGKTLFTNHLPLWGERRVA